MQVARLIEPRDERTSARQAAADRARLADRERASPRAGSLDRYLTLAPFGGNLEGVRAASLAYFGKEPRKLTIGEAALLVALPQSPETRRPDRFPEAARVARARVLDRVAARGIITPDEAERGRARADPRRPQAASRCSPPHAAEEAVAADPNARVLQAVDRRAPAGEARDARPRARPTRLGPKLSAAIVVDRQCERRGARAHRRRRLSRRRARRRASTCRARRARRARR